MELKYRRMDTYMPLYGPLDAKLNEGADKGSVSYILFGGNSYFGDNSKSKAMSYAGAALGIGIVDMKDGGSATKFACDAKLGVQLKTASSVSFKFHAYIQNVIAAIGSDFYYTAGVVLLVCRIMQAFSNRFRRCSKH